MRAGGRARGIRKALCLSAVIAVIPACFGGLATAGTIDIWSQPASGSNSRTVTNVAVTASPVWATPTGSQYEWISYTDTGCNFFNVQTGRCIPGPDNPAGTSVTGAPTASFYQTFSLSSAVTGTLEVWADDTASVWLEHGSVTSGDGSSGGTMLYAANGQLGTNCSNAPIGCLPGMDAVIPLTLGPGTYTLVVDAYQLVGGSPFGVMYDGQLHTGGSSAPEPASYLLMGFGLAGVATVMRRRKRT